jgi:hypothetical protein
MRLASALRTDEALRVAKSSRVLPPESMRMMMAATQY